MTRKTLVPAENAPIWRTSSFSDGGNTCVEIAPLIDGSGTAIRDSTRHGDGSLTASNSMWRAFQHAVCAPGGFR